MKVNELLNHRKTQWKSIWISYMVQSLTGIQVSIFYTSMWPYLNSIDPHADLSFFGWIIASFNIGQMMSSWTFGYWNQKTMSTRYPVSCGLVFMAVGNFIYGLLPIFSDNRQWFMLLARFTVGFGSGNLIVLRTYCATATSEKDRTKAVSLAIGAFVGGLSMGPVLQALFTPIGKKGFSLGVIVLNMYTTPALLMVLISNAAIFMLFAFFEENYAGILSVDKRSWYSIKTHFNAFIVIPKFDKVPALICMYLWFTVQCISTNVEVIATPLTISLYKWTDTQAVFYNGLLLFISCILSVLNYLVLAYTFIGQIDKRKLMIFSFLCFLLYHLFVFPWPFYDGPLDYVEIDTSLHGGCFRKYKWCSHTTKVPLTAYILCFTIIFGFAFPYLAGPVGTIFSQILGPRKQGIMQGLFELGGCIARCVAPIILTILFESSGYLWSTISHIIMLLIGLFLLIIFYKRIVPLKVVPEIGVPTVYKSGVFYRL
ncbi:unnamed protein product [Dracunculus medinensis]|uniref:MFS domain-containing protein n=1 Tax=Dracunculus medinensis TaxID=318479 RepID=A0A158Q589_DRAME|nr:unnamed protein product [Dracunculus medinensis]